MRFCKLIRKLPNACNAVECPEQTGSLPGTSFKKMHRLPIPLGMLSIRTIRCVILYFVVVCLLGTSCAFGEEGQNGTPEYKTGWGAMVKLGITLQRNLPPEYRAQVHARPVNLEMDVMPFVRLEEMVNPNTSQKMACVFVSVGFVDLVNNVAHAKAIDRIEKGYFENYILSLSRENGQRQLQPLPRISDPRFWTDRMMNEQQSNFNQIVGGVIGSKLAHYYLGHCQKYSSQLGAGDGKPLPINAVLTPKDWDDALQHGVNNALSCGYGVEGVEVFFDCIDKMPVRPAWTLYFLPATVKVATVNKELEKLEKKFFGHM
jgi:hypothetical protein